MASPYNVPRNIRRYAFNGSVAAAGTVIGKTGEAGVVSTIANVAATDVIIEWELKASADNTDNLEHKQGPAAEAFAAAAAPALANYDILLPGENYSVQLRHGEQELNTSNTQDQVLLIRSSGATSVVYSGWVKVYRPET